MDDAAIRQWKLLRALESAGRGLTIEELGQAVGASEPAREGDLQALVDAGLPVVQEGVRWRVLQPGEGAWTVPVEPSQVLALALGERLLGQAAASELGAPLAELGERLLSRLAPAGQALCEQLLHPRPFIGGHRSRAHALGLDAQGHVRHAVRDVDRGVAVEPGE